MYLLLNENVNVTITMTLPIGVIRNRRSKCVIKIRDRRLVLRRNRTTLNNATLRTNRMRLCLVLKVLNNVVTRNFHSRDAIINSTVPRGRRANPLLGMTKTVIRMVDTIRRLTLDKNIHYPRIVSVTFRSITMRRLFTL